MQLIDGMLKTGRLTEFVNEFIDITNEETQDTTVWELWLHKVMEQSYSDFRRSLGIDNTAAAPPTQDELVSIAKESKEILQCFALNREGKEQNGTVQAAGNNRNRHAESGAGA